MQERERERERESKKKKVDAGKDGGVNNIISE